MVRKLNKMNEAQPLYAQIADDLRFKIQTEEWKVGDQIPPELELCELYKVSRITVRKAIDVLVRKNLLYRERAKGTFVGDGEESENNHITFVRSFTNEMKEIGKKAETLFAEVGIIKANKTLAKHLEINVGDEVLQLKRLRGTENIAFAFFVSAIPFTHEYSLDSNDYYGSFYEYLSQFGISIDQQKEYIEAVLAPSEAQKLLGINNEPVLKRVRMTSQKESNFREYSECYYIGSQYRYYIDFS
ncbi:GntR family transcriptional regulator [Peribacillus loiseleuriae]|uniref:GntR family transcriptional regulator n=1 Tax=Peribacillus loiseleuriae TaxID=1679170 RepID=A0A0K9GTK8_9BACI|nr:GntR family transcriptional regulator [Peribacillus loiseleuriae]KMY49980.1 GntR family transcriptional regulator [Peribacillus loiseleuriae]